MNARLDNLLTGADPLLRGVVITSVAIAVIGMLLLVRASPPRPPPSSRGPASGEPPKLEAAFGA